MSLGTRYGTTAGALGNGSACFYLHSIHFVYKIRQLNVQELKVNEENIVLLISKYKINLPPTVLIFFIKPKNSCYRLHGRDSNLTFPSQNNEALSIAQT